MSETTTEILCRNDGSFSRRVITETNLGPLEEYLQQLVKSSPVTIKNAFKVRDQMVGVQKLDEKIVTWHDIPELKIDTVATVLRGIAFPLFKKLPTQDTVEHISSFTFRPEIAGMVLTMVTGFQAIETGYSWRVSYLLARKIGERPVFRPPLPNLHTDARICMGSDYAMSAPTLLDAVESVWTYLDASSWNSDIIGGLTIDWCRAIYSFKDGIQIPPTAEWKDICRPVSVDMFNNLPL